MFRVNDPVMLKQTGERGHVSVVRWTGPYAPASVLGPQYVVDLAGVPVGVYECDLEVVT